jgi:glycosyltransferase involved in cell wall biosynthesis
MVSVITPVYNSEEFLSETIESVIAQTYRNWEMIIVDDCSADHSPEIANRYAQADERIRVTSLSSNSGPAVARNRAIEMAKGRYIAFLDSDDLWEPDKLEKQIAFMKENSYAITYSYYGIMDESGNEVDQFVTPPSKIAYKDLLTTNYIGCLTAVYDSHILGKVYMPNILKRQDYGLWLRILKDVDYAYGIKEPLATYRIRKNSVSRNKFKAMYYVWKLFREIEGINFFKSLYFISIYGYNGLKKYMY